MKWHRVNGGYESKPRAYRVEKVKGGWMPMGYCSWIAERGENPWRALYRHPFKTATEAKRVCAPEPAQRRMRGTN